MTRDISGPVAVPSMRASPLGALGRAENGGGNLAVRRLCEGLAESGIPTDVFVRRDDPLSPAEEMIAPMSRLVRLHVGPARGLPKQALVDHVDAFARAVTAHAASERRQYRVVHGHYWLSGLVAQRLRQAWAIPWVQSFHSLARAKTRAGLPHDARRALAEDMLVAAADRLVTGSVAEARDLMRLYGASRDHICVAQPGVDLRVLRPRDAATLRADLGLEGHRVLLFAGRLEPLKGADTLLNAVARLCDAPRFDDVITLVIGEDSGDGAAGGGGGGRGGRGGGRPRSGIAGAVPRRRRARGSRRLLRPRRHLRGAVAHGDVRAGGARGAGARHPGGGQRCWRPHRDHRRRADGVPGARAAVAGVRGCDRQAPR